MSSNYTQDFIDEVKGCRTPVVSGEGGVDLEVREALDKHTADDSIHLTAEEAKALIPDALPADGGNADTLDGLHANEIASNPNLLINPDMSIDQRGMGAEVTGSNSEKIYPADCWYLAGAGTVKFDGDIIECIPAEGDTPAFYLDQLLPLEPLLGKTLTFSVETADGVLVSATGTVPESIPETNTSVAFAIAPDKARISMLARSNGTFMCQVLSQNLAYSSKYKRAFKLEIGSVATPFTPPDPATELAKCQRYLFELPQWYKIRALEYADDYITFGIPAPVNMRITPSILKAENLAVKDVNINSSVISDFTWSVTGVYGNMIQLTAYKTAHGFTDCTARAVGGSVLFSAEL